MKQTIWDLIKSDCPTNLQITEPQWRELAKYISNHRLEGFVYSRFKKDIPSDLAEDYSQVWKQQWMQNTTHLHWTKRIAVECFKNGFQITALKGLSLLDKIYEDLGARQMSDIDVLVEPQNLKVLSEILKSMEFTETKENKWMGNVFKKTLSLKKNDSTVVVEIHTQLFWHQKKKFILETIPTGNKGLHFLKTEENLMHLIGHLAFQHNFSKLFWLIDIDRFIRANYNNINWDYMYNLATRLQLKSSFQTTLAVLQDKLQTPLPNNINLNPITSLLINKSFLLNVKPGFRYQLIKHAMKDSILDALKYDFYWFMNKITFLKS